MLPCSMREGRFFSRMVLLKNLIFCLVQYLKEKYAKTGKIENGVITMMDAFREERHDVLYSLDEIKVKMTETKTAIETARTLLKASKTLVG